MCKVILLFTLIMLSTEIIASEWVSPIDHKYQLKDASLFEKFDKARNILNSWGGQRKILNSADKLLKEILEKDGSFAPAYREFGRLLIMAGYVSGKNFKKGSLNPAEASIMRSIEIEPDYADSYVLLGHLYTNMRRYSDAEKSLTKAENIGTEIPWLQLNWADLHKRQKNYSKAMKRYQAVITSGTSNRKAYLKALSGVTNINLYMRNYDQANMGYNKQIEYNPNDAWTWGNYSIFLLFKYNDVDGAILKGRKALEIMNYGVGRFHLACALFTKWAMLKSNDPVAAKIYYEEAINLYPHPEKVIEETRKYKYTSITAAELQIIHPIIY